MTAPFAGRPRAVLLTLGLTLACVAGIALLLAPADEDRPSRPAHPGPAAQAPAPGAAGIGDPLAPLDGNGGYTVRRYTLDFDWQAPRTPFRAGATVSAVATQALSRFDLDFAGNTLHSVTVDGVPAKDVRREGDELVLTPPRPIARGRAFTVRVSYTADPTQQRHRDDAIGDYGWMPTADGTVLLAQPDGAKMVFPVDDHPSLRAPVTFHVTTPPDVSAVANGRLVERKRRPGGRVTWTYDSEQPIAAQLVQLAIGRFTFVDSTGPRGLPVRDVVPTGDLVAGTEESRALTPEHLRWLEQRLGPYPFGRYGVLVGDADLPVALETQSLSVVPSADLLGDQVDAERNLVHELAHHWTGNSVAIARWSDLWLSEGHARYYERLYSAEHGGRALEDVMRAAYEQHDQWRHDDGAPAEPSASSLFRQMRYDGSALVLYALREEVGEETFGRIERTWVTRYQGRAAGTREFIALASEVAGRDLTQFLKAWLYGPRTPPMPGHPDWQVDPVVAE
ncbi:M1 family metallopeptidase [Streptomyces sp. V3I7]|uniref:M1 family metallopeptidase n=1 Tax=Streptomyces sp. V3I7 TaxID=3042278 RepID=UPI002785723F|nr:M1 family metallopeptidase [Streptomyces sp. V3I7]MDQ0991979.1 aminopeptidase N [Streptomyces sp. V3I7]